MTLARTAVTAAALCLIFGTTLALADTAPADMTSCSQLSDQVKAAISANAQSPNLDAAKVERRDGSDACRMGFYKLGIEHYRKALALLTGS